MVGGKGAMTSTAEGKTIVMWYLSVGRSQYEYALLWSVVSYFHPHPLLIN